MAIMNSVRRLFTRRHPVELKVSHLQDPDGDPIGLVVSEEDGEPSSCEDEQPLNEDFINQPMAVLGRIEQALEANTSSGTALVASTQKIPEVARTLSSLCEGQKELVELTRTLHQDQHSRSEAERATTERIGDSLDRQNETLGLVQRQLDANHQVAAQTAEHLTSVSEGLTESMNASRRTAEAMSALVGEMRTRDARTAERFSRLQGWMVACIVAGLAALIAAVTLTWVIFSGPTSL